ncbi:HXXEE domain-containing protein [Streptomyces sp. NPDC014734]|uniref:HXXEE domain-containing protein n=1 Tax=Streptomyces sp. NPDC014734 TaxID=3364886 RepID=UPI0036FD75ED
MTRATVSKAVTWGLLAAWAANDLEELATMAGWARSARPELRKRLPRVPERVWARMELSQREVAVAIGLVGVVMAAASADGARTGGRSPFFRTVLVGFGAHGVVHLAQSLAYRGYTPGVVTAPTVVVPYSVWAVRRLRAAGVEVGGTGTTAAASALLPLIVAGAHGLARGITGAHRRGDGAPR